MWYKKVNWKYQLKEEKSFTLTKDMQLLCPDFSNDYIEIHGRKVKVLPGYCWDGPSGPTIDTKTFMLGALFHDVLYQLMRLGVLSQDSRKAADDFMKKVNLDNGMCSVRAWYTHKAVRIFGASSAKFKGRNKYKQ